MPKHLYNLRTLESINYRELAGHNNRGHFNKYRVKRIKEVKTKVRWVPFRPSLADHSSRHSSILQNKEKYQSRYTPSRTRLGGDSLWGAKTRFLKKAKRAGLEFNESDKLHETLKEAEKKLGIGFQAWKTGREAQHLIPVTLGIQLGLPDSELNSEDNFMMLRGGNSNHKTAEGVETVGEGDFRKLSKDYIDYKKGVSGIEGGRFKNFLKKPKHILKGTSHSDYDLHVLDVIEAMALQAEGGVVDLKELKIVLRQMHKTGNMEFVDNMRGKMDLSHLSIEERIKRARNILNESYGQAHSSPSSETLNQRAMANESASTDNLNSLKRTRSRASSMKMRMPKRVLLEENGAEME